MKLAFDDLNKKHNQKNTKNYLKTHLLKTLATRFLKDEFQSSCNLKIKYTLYSKHVSRKQNRKM
jgi:hypothetical protein